jgi:putative chitinase
MYPTENKLLEFAPNCLPEYLVGLCQSPEPYQRAGITEPLVLAHLLAQMAHETGGFTLLREHTGWKPQQMVAMWPGRFKSTKDPRILLCKGDPVKLAQLAYGPAAMPKLGNVDEDDGFAYRGGGALQLTGRSAYHECGLALGIDLEGQPELIEHPDAILPIALWYWAKMDCTRFAARGYSRTVGNAINRGDPFSTKDPIGFASREQWLQRAIALFAPHARVEGDELALGAYGPKVKELQVKLQELGYQVGAIDGIFGPSLARAIAAFKLDDEIATDQECEPREIVGPKVWHALSEATPIKLTQERENASAKELLAKGSTEVRAGNNGKHAGRLFFSLGAFGGAEQLGLVDQVTASLSKVSALQASLVPVIGAVTWSLKNIFWLCVIAAGIWYWQKGHEIVSARLAAHRSGANLAR